MISSTEGGGPPGGEKGADRIHCHRGTEKSHSSKNLIGFARNRLCLNERNGIAVSKRFARASFRSRAEDFRGSRLRNLRIAEQSLRITL